MVLWELLTCEIPYKDVDSSAIIWGVGSSSLNLPVPTTCPDGFRMLMKQCWSPKPRNRPSFKQILMHIDIAEVQLLSFQAEEYFKTQVSLIIIFDGCFLVDSSVTIHLEYGNGQICYYY